jgi:hypothetical protein
VEVEQMMLLEVLLVVLGVLHLELLLGHLVHIL